MRYKNLYKLTRVQQLLIRAILLDRKKRKDVIENFCFQETNNMVVGHNEILHAVGGHDVFHSFVGKACKHFVSDTSNKNASLSRVQSFAGLQVPIKYFSAKEALLYAFNSYAHGYNKREKRSWRIVAFLKSASENEQTKDLSFLLGGLMAFNDAISDGVKVKKANLAYDIFDQIEKDSSVYEVSLLFKATCEILNSNFEEALKLVIEAKDISNNLVFSRYEKNLRKYLHGVNRPSTDQEYLKIVA